MTSMIPTIIDLHLFYLTWLFFLDLRKAFDTVDHNILLGKLQYYGFRGITSTWLSSYLSDRKQTTEIAGRISKQAYINCGGATRPDSWSSIVSDLYQ